MIPQYEPLLTRADARAAARVIRSGWIGPGRECEAFKRNLHKILPYDSEIALTNSGTSALMAGMASLHMPQGSTVLCPAYGMHAAANVAVKLGMKVELIDVDSESGNIESSKLRNELVNRNDVRAVVLIRNNGKLSEDAEDISSFCSMHAIALIDDACQATDHQWQEGFKPSFSVVSFSPHKLITTGQGGAICVNLNQSRWHGNCRISIQDVDRYINCGRWVVRDRDVAGLNLRMSDIQAAVGNSQMERYREITRKRVQLHQWYGDAFDKVLGHLATVNTGWFVTTRCTKSIDMPSFLRAYGIEAKKLYRPTNHYPQFAHCKGPFPEAEKAARETIYLPSSLTLTRRQVRRVVRAIGKFYETMR